MKDKYTDGNILKIEDDAYSAFKDCFQYFDYDTGSDGLSMIVKWAEPPVISRNENGEIEIVLYNEIKNSIPDYQTVCAIEVKNV